MNINTEQSLEEIAADLKKIRQLLESLLVNLARERNALAVYVRGGVIDISSEAE